MSGGTDRYSCPGRSWLWQESAVSHDLLLVNGLDKNPPLISQINCINVPGMLLFGTISFVLSSENFNIIVLQNVSICTKRGFYNIVRLLYIMQFAYKNCWIMNSILYHVGLFLQLKHLLKLYLQNWKCNTNYI